jgi:hypothetical protein
MRFGGGGRSTVMRTSDGARDYAGGSISPHLALGKFIADRLVVFGAVDGGRLTGYEIRSHGDLIGTAAHDRILTSVTWGLAIMSCPTASFSALQRA